MYKLLLMISLFLGNSIFSSIPCFDELGASTIRQAVTNLYVDANEGRPSEKDIENYRRRLEKLRLYPLSESDRSRLQFIENRLRQLG